MNAAANGPDGPAERERLFAEIADLKAQRNDLLAQLADCRRQLRELRDQLDRGDDA